MSLLRIRNSFNYVFKKKRMLLNSKLCKSVLLKMLLFLHFKVLLLDLNGKTVNSNGEMDLNGEILIK